MQNFEITDPRDRDRDTSGDCRYGFSVRTRPSWTDGKVRFESRSLPLLVAAIISRHAR